MLYKIAEALKGQSYTLTSEEVERAENEGTLTWISWIHTSSLEQINKRMRYIYAGVESIPIEKWHRVLLAFIAGRETEIAMLNMLAHLDPVENIWQGKQSSNHWDLRVGNELLDVKLLAHVETTVSFSNFSKISTMYKAHEPVALLAVERVGNTFTPAMLISQQALKGSLFVQKTDKHYTPGMLVDLLLNNQPSADPMVCVLTSKGGSSRFLNNGTWILNRKFDWKPS